jgi:D-serine deaminase-like pyridoxal phosphate-dependent protein
VSTTTAIASALLAESETTVRRRYGWSLGCRVSELPTPALVLDLAAARRNIEAMARQLEGAPATIRPHFKAHKSPELARLQAAAGAIGISAATAWEALVLVAAGLDHVFVVNEVVDTDKIDLLADQARSADLMVAVDDPGNVDDLAEATLRAGSRLGVLVDVDTGMGRCGVRSATAAIDLAERVSRTSSLDFRGVTGYEGHCSRTPDRRRRHRLQGEAMGMLVDTATRIDEAGIPCPIRSAGGTATWEWTAWDPGITEIQAGTYAVMDEFHGAMVGGF